MLPRHGRRPAVTAAHTDGCDHAYGNAAQCLPLHTTGGAAHICAYLTRGGYFTTPLLVHRDPLHLMQKQDVQMTTSGKVPTISACTD